MAEEFTFPTVVVPPEHYCCDDDKMFLFPRLCSSPTPWFVVSAGAMHAAVAVAAAAPHDHHRSCLFSAGVGGGDGDRRSGFCNRRGSERFVAAAAAAKEEHGMDLLWEDFNEELSRAAPPPCPISKEWASEAWLPGSDGGDRHVSIAGSVVRPRRRRLSLVVLLKLLKRLFLARKSHSASSLPEGRERCHQYD